MSTDDLKDADSPPSESGFRRAFQAIAEHFGRPAATTVLFSGVPFDLQKPDRDALDQLARRIGLSVELIESKEARAAAFKTPALLFTNGGRVIALTDLGPDGRYKAFDGMTAKGFTVAASELRGWPVAAAYAFHVIYHNTAERAEIGGATQIERGHWLVSTMKPFWRGYAQVALATVFINLIALASPIFVMNVYDRILPNKATASLMSLAGGVILALVFDYLLKSARSGIIEATGKAADMKLSSLLFDKVLHTTLAERSGSTGEFASRISQYEFVREFFTSNTLSTLIDTVFVFIFLIVIFSISGWIVVVPIAAFVLSVIVGLIAQFRIGKRVATAANESARRQSLLVETISTIETVKSLQAEAHLLRKWNELARISAGTAEAIKTLTSQAANLTGLIQQLVTVFIVLAGAYEFSAGNVSTGAIIATVMLSGRTVSPLTQIAITLARFRQAMLSLRILNMVMDLPEDRPSTIGFVNREIQSGAFAFEAVSFAYPRNDFPVLRNLNLAVRSGEKVGIIGRIGSGKTTFGRLLAGLYPAGKGRVLIDGIDIRQFHPATVRSAVAFAGQSADLFSGTLKENIRLGRPDATDEQILAAAKAAAVDEFASRHPRGYDLTVGERGENLSGGQRQAVAIARLLLASPRIVFLDEPSGSMDLASERQLIRTLAGAFGPEVTMVISTHRHSLLELVDRLVVLDQGTVVADGPKTAVLNELAARAKAGHGGGR